VNLFDGIYNQLAVPGFLVNSMPKAGTHLVMKAVGMFPGITRTRGQITNRLADRGTTADESRADIALIGVDWPRPVTVPALRRALKRIRRGHYAQAHTRCSDQLVALLTELGMRTLLILRDPRDVVVSHAKYVSSKERHFLFDRYQPLSDSERVMKSIVGMRESSESDQGLLSIADRYQSLLPWVEKRLNYTTFFERLVGPQGGGSRDVQIHELNNIARHLAIRHNSAQVETVADHLFGGTTTFRKGTIGGWQTHFTDVHKRVFKDLAGQLLIDLGYEQDLDW
jgi:hypothetical protein